MPTILRVGPYRLFFYASDGVEPMHVHVQRDESVAKFWLDPIRLARNQGFRRQELLDVQSIVTENRQQLVQAWHEYFSI